MHFLIGSLKRFLGWLKEPMDTAPSLRRIYLVRCGHCGRHGPGALTLLDAKALASTAGFGTGPGWQERTYYCSPCSAAYASPIDPGEKS